VPPSPPFTNTRSMRPVSGPL